VLDFRFSRWEGYKKYHVLMMRIGDCDPAYPALRYVADRFELTLEQRCWLAWLYAASYCAATAYYMISEFPDYENVDVRRLENWWAANKHRCLFQTDRLRVKTQDQFVRMFVSYRKMMGDSQVETWKRLLRPSPGETYDAAYECMGKLYYFSRYSLFLFLEAVHRLTKFPMAPTGIDLRNAESCRNGLCYATHKDGWVKRPLTNDQWKYLHRRLKQLYRELKEEHASLPIDYWNIETSLCAYKKLFWRTRYLGYYIDRQMAEIIKMQSVEGVDWSVLWDFRREFFHPALLGEVGGWRGPRPWRCNLVMDRGALSDIPFPDVQYKYAVEFPGAWSAYGEPSWR